MTSRGALTNYKGGVCIEEKVTRRLLYDEPLGEPMGTEKVLWGKKYVCVKNLSDKRQMYISHKNKFRVDEILKYEK